MPFPWQEIIVLAVVAVAAGYLAYRSSLLVFRKKVGGCGTCSNCPEESEDASRGARQLVTLTSVASRSESPAGRTQSRKGAKI